VIAFLFEMILPLRGAHRSSLSCFNKQPVCWLVTRGYTAPTNNYYVVVTMYCMLTQLVRRSTSCYDASDGCTSQHTTSESHLGCHGTPYTEGTYSVVALLCINSAPCVTYADCQSALNDPVKNNSVVFGG
jgi:hypothetical protein